MTSMENQKLYDKLRSTFQNIITKKTLHTPPKKLYSFQKELPAACSWGSSSKLGTTMWPQIKFGVKVRYTYHGAGDSWHSLKIIHPRYRG